jgi:hypothetical protein
VSVVSNQVEGSAMGRSHIQRSHTGYVVSVISKHRQVGGLGPNKAVAP